MFNIDIHIYISIQIYLLLPCDDDCCFRCLGVISQRHVKPEDEDWLLGNAVGLTHQEVDQLVG